MCFCARWSISYLWVSYYANKPQKLFMVIHLSFLQAIQRINLIFFSLRRHILVSLTIAKIAGSDCGCWGKVHRYLTGKETAGRPAENSTTKCCPMFFLWLNHCSNHIALFGYALILENLQKTQPWKYFAVRGLRENCLWNMTTLKHRHKRHTLEIHLSNQGKLIF